jgi:antitoxin CptB
MRLYMPAPTQIADMPDADEPILDPRRRRLRYRAWHRGTKEADLIVGAFVDRHIAGFTEAELDELEAVLELSDVDLADWISRRRDPPPELRTTMLTRILDEAGR